MGTDSEEMNYFFQKNQQGNIVQPFTRLHNSNFHIFPLLAHYAKGVFLYFSPSFSHISKFVMAFGTALVWKKHPVWIWKLCSTCVPIIFLNILLHWASKTRKSTFSYTCSITTSDNIGATNSRRALSKTIHFYSFETKSKGKDTSEWRVKVRISSAPHAYRMASVNKKK